MHDLAALDRKQSPTGSAAERLEAAARSASRLAELLDDQALQLAVAADSGLTVNEAVVALAACGERLRTTADSLSRLAVRATPSARPA